jgi:threonine aldolase
VIDLRSDTVTRPTPAMRTAMANAEVGDDMLGEDPTVNRLERLMADMFGKEAAVFVCSGTQGNQLAVRTHCDAGDELLINETGHIANFEGGAAAALSGVTSRTISAPDGMLDVSDLKDKIRADDQHLCRTRLVCLENTTNLGGGRTYPLQQMQRVAEWAWSNDLKMHLDGARVFNAVVAAGYDPADIGACFNTVSVCFSKGLGCPMGSILLGSEREIYRARRFRKVFGGALRQAGIVAAAALHAMQHHVARLSDDHQNARDLADQISQIDGITIDPQTVETNLIYFEVDPALGTAVQLAGALKSRGVLIGPSGGQRMRAVTHLDVTSQDIQQVVEAIATAVTTGFSEQPLVGDGPYNR